MADDRSNTTLTCRICHTYPCVCPDDRTDAKVLKAARAPIVDTPMSASEMMSAIRKTHDQPNGTPHEHVKGGIAYTCYCPNPPARQQTTLERDADRYRWLREHQDLLPYLSHCSRDLQARTLDAFIDAELERACGMN